ncbi:TRAP transporter small permease [Nitratireductor luteus]|uniref:TRAP transporter small permease n=1 Tax=Nitratireductor luteus TaxID=2976980 RepID=UPI00223FF50A|nr:TRAP transporter small permease [Nitratireductor luteus]
MFDSAKTRYSFEGSAAAIIFIVLLGVMLLQVVGRTGYFNPPIWTEELSRWLWVWMAFIGIAEVERTDTHLRMDIIPEMMARTARIATFTIIDLLYLGITCHLIWIGYRGVLRSWNNAAVSLPVSDALLYASFPIAGIFIVYRVANRVIRRIGRSRGQG